MAKEDENSFDYIHSVERLIALDDPALRPKRQKIEKLRSQHPGLEIRRLNLSEPQTTDEIRRLCERWRESKGCSENEFAIERAAIERCLSSVAHFDFVTIGALLDGALAGFTINEVVHNGCYMSHFGKTSSTLSGCSDLLESETARVMREFGCMHMNNQQDLGLPGLRHYKRSWAPESFLRKFSIELNSAPARFAILSRDRLNHEPTLNSNVSNRATTRWRRTGELSLGHAVNWLTVYAFEFVLYPLVIWKLGLWRGGAAMALLSLIACLLTLWFYDWSKRDWLGIETIKQLRDGEGRSRLRRVLAWALSRGDWMAFVALSVKFDPFITTIYMRRGAFNGMTRQDWRVFMLSWLISNVWWALVCFGGIEVLRGLWHAGRTWFPHG